MIHHLIELRNELGRHWSITYLSKSDSFHIYLEDFRLCYIVKIVDVMCGDYDYVSQNGIALKIKRVLSKYREGETSFILLYSDYAKGPECGVRKCSWNLESYKEFINRYGQAPYYMI